MQVIPSTSISSDWTFFTLWFIIFKLWNNVQSNQITLISYQTTLTSSKMNKTGVIIILSLCSSPRHLYYLQLKSSILIFKNSFHTVGMFNFVMWCSTLWRTHKMAVYKFHSINKMLQIHPILIFMLTCYTKCCV